MWNVRGHDHMCRCIKCIAVISRLVVSRRIWRMEWLPSCCATNGVASDRGGNQYGPQRKHGAAVVPTSNRRIANGEFSYTIRFVCVLSAWLLSINSRLPLSTFSIRYISRQPTTTNETGTAWSLVTLHAMF
ncbi:hypothetical protein KQX54_010451 [Cotesia glomerata]|uniref:Secreted protein n=1 Tax=Cotesia glomerata TaxID=32391 RepID=A0AAV7J332_COTGL|nr:hypothetical protein KQX54_010451 [Cotesia glomerata]